MRRAWLFCEYPLDELGLGFCVVEPVSAEPGGEHAFERRVLSGSVGICPHAVPERHVPLERPALGRHQVQVVRISVRRRPKRLTTLDPAVAPVLVTERCQEPDRTRDVALDSDGDIDVDYRLRCESGDSSAPDVLYGEGLRAKRSRDPGLDQLELRWPVRVVLDDYDWRFRLQDSYTGCLEADRII